MATPRTLARIDALIWSLIYGGLFCLVLGIASHDETAIGGWSLSVLGALAVLAGGVLIVVRSRLREESGPGAQSPETRTGDSTR
jgi:hypothetical protein